MAVVVKVLNNKSRFSSNEEISVFLYAHDSFTPSKGLSFSADVFKSSSGLLGSVTIDEVPTLPGYYTASIDDQLGETDLGDYFILIKESGSEIGFMDFVKGPYLAKSEGAAVDNKRYENLFASTPIDYRNIVPESLERTRIGVKKYADTDFSNKLTEGDVLYSYLHKSPRSDVQISSPVIEKPLETKFLEAFESISWITENFSETFEDSSWSTGDFVEDFEDTTWN
jgi:hypothetical protein